MSDKFYRIPIERLFKWTLAEEKEGKILGLYKDNLFDPQNKKFLSISRFGQRLETPFGVAAGPHTQMAQNIIASWLVGARFIELKTVQTLDELEVTKPCIDMEDEGYNCEWSQELKVKDAFDEYLNAWILIHLLKAKFGWNNIEPGFIFNMSVGYNLEGILNSNVQWFFDKMHDCKDEKEEKLDILSNYYPDAHKLKISDQISNNITLSTMHGCPSDEIEKIGRYLLEEKKLHTSIKLNPTLLGKERLRFILNDKLGYNIEVPDLAFEHDLNYHDAVKMIKNLKEISSKNNLEFSLKLTNTLESTNSTKWLPENERMVYTSGRALHPISINLAEKLQSDFKGELDISFSAGIDAFNVSDTLACNLKPITICSDLLKPGGYLRMTQYLEQLENNFDCFNVRSVKEFILKISGKNSEVEGGFSNLRKYSIAVIDQQKYKKSAFPFENIKTKRDLTPYDCIHAPCIEDCAVSQDVPEYMYHTANQNFKEAFNVILRDNPLPNITGNVCDHICQPKCTRINYDNPLLIRAIKRFNAERFEGKLDLVARDKNGLKVAILGGGPSGLSCSYFLALNGFAVDLYEAKSFAGGMVSDSIPHFRLTDEQIEADLNIIKSLGVNFHFNTRVTKDLFSSLLKNNDFIYIGIGAQKAKKLNIPGESIENVHDQLTFLSKIRGKEKISLGHKVAIIGGGNSAIDAARTSKRLVGESGSVTVIYRRTISEMPADPEEIRSLLEEGIYIIELAAPKTISKKNDRLEIICQKMELGDIDSSGRRKPIPIDGSEFSMEIDSIITAIGQDTILDFLEEKKLEITRDGETQFKNVFAGGDATRGADSLINATADGKDASEIISKRANQNHNTDFYNVKNKISFSEFQKKQSYRNFGKKMPETNLKDRGNFELVHPNLNENDAISEAERCLFCNDICNICIGVCPNFANVSYEAEKSSIPVYILKNDDINDVEIFEHLKIEQSVQIFNIGDFCNECGNCNTFCPTSGAPYIVKPKFYLTEKSFSLEDKCYYLANDIIKYKDNGNIETLEIIDENYIYSNQFLRVTLHSNDYKIGKIEFIDGSKDFVLRKAAEMIYLLENLNNKLVFADI